MANPVNLPFKYAPTPFATISYFVLLGLYGFLFLGRKAEWSRIPFLLELDPGFYTHISNFSIAGILLLGIGYLWLLMGVPFRVAAYFGIAIALTNVVYEAAVPILNVPDITDAWYGVFGVAIGMGILRAISRYGLTTTDTTEPNS